MIIGKYSNLILGTASICAILFAASVAMHANNDIGKLRGSQETGTCHDKQCLKSLSCPQGCSVTGAMQCKPGSAGDTCWTYPNKGTPCSTSTNDPAPCKAVPYANGNDC